MCAATPGQDDGVDLVAEAKRAPRGAAAAGLPACDLVMKGGITSGVVYPGAVIALAQSYRFAAVGGTSAGAIAAGVCAAAEYGRLGDEDGGLEELGAISEQLSQEDFLLGLFHATPGARPLMDLALLAAKHSEDPLPRRTMRLAIAACRRAPMVAVPALVALLALTALTWGAFRGFPAPLAVLLTLVAGVPLAALALAATAVGAGGLLVARAVRSLRASNYGLCPGTPQPGYPDGQPALTDWLHERVQSAAGRESAGRNEVLTVEDLAGCGIGLETMTTDLSRGRPLRCPLDLDGYHFRPSEMSRLFPADVVARLVEPERTHPDPGSEELHCDELRKLDPGRLPVLVAIRLSLSFPGLLSAVPLYRCQEDGGTFRQSLFSDGGIASNFPVHFFDAWFPRWPTFGIDLSAHPGGGARSVLMHGEDGATAYRTINGLTAFAGQIKDTMQNWRDNLQAELPGFRERVCDVRFAPGEGGLNLRMEPPEIETLMRRGHSAGELLAQALPMTTAPQSPTPNWLRHCLTRFEILMALEQRGLQAVAERSSDFLERLEGGGLTPPGRVAWARAAVEQTEKLLDCTRQWGPPPAPVDFELPPPPEPVMRIVPKA